MITVVDYDPAWPAQFEALRSGYQHALAGITVVAIEHVGSTSVPGLAAKPLIDIDIIVAAEHLQHAIDAMQRAGFESIGECGIPDRWALRAPPGLPGTNTYVVVDGCLGPQRIGELRSSDSAACPHIDWSQFAYRLTLLALRNHLAVRDVLRGDDLLRDEYAAIKRAIASSVDDIDHYVEQKSEFLSSVLGRAGLTEQERTQIEDANRSS